MKILVIEDNEVIAKQLVEFLSSHAWSVDWARTGQLGIQLAADHIFDVVLLDLNLPDIDGVSVCLNIKNSAHVEPPILMLTARDSFEDKAEGFHNGADDYMVKPFDLREVALRCEALARRNALHKPKQYRLGELYLNLNNQVVMRRGQRLKLSATAFNILKILIQAHPEPVARRTLLHTIWGDTLPDSDSLKSHIYSLRNALDKPFDKPILVTIHQVGYRLDLS